MKYEEKQQPLTLSHLAAHVSTIPLLTFCRVWTDLLDCKLIIVSKIVVNDPVGTKTNQIFKLENLRIREAPLLL